MARLNERLATARRALASLARLTGRRPGSDVERDAAIQRFEYSFEAVWKLAQLFLAEAEGLTAGSPKACVRASLQAGLLDAAQAARALRMVDDRNLTSHTYNEALARRLGRSLPAHARLMGAWVDAVEGRLRPELAPTPAKRRARRVA